MANLSDLVLLRNDPVVAAEFLRAEQQGDSGAHVLRKVVAAGMTAERFDRAELLLQEDCLVQGRAVKKLHRRRNSKQHQTVLD